MKSHHLTWICVLGTGTLAGVLLGTLLTGPVETTVETARAEPAAADLPQLALGEDDAPPPFRFEPPDARVRVAELREEFAAAAAPADDDVEGDVGEDPLPVEKPAPQVLPPAHREATPLSAARERFVRETIAERMPHATPEEQEVWYEELKGLDPDVLVEVLNIRNSLGAMVPLPPIQFDILPERTPVPDPAEDSDPLVALPDLEPTVPTVTSPATPSIEPSPLPTPAPPAVTIAPENAIALENTLVALRRAERVLLDNVANAGTLGYRRRRPQLAELPIVDEPTARPAVRLGNGSYLAATPLDTEQGPLRNTGRPLDVAITGAGWFQVTRDADVLYTRAGSLTQNADGLIVTHQGWPLEPNITIPADTNEILIDGRGTVSARTDAATKGIEIGVIQTARFVNPAALVPLGDDLFAASDASGPPRVGTPGTDGRGRIAQATVEMSNVHLDEERRELARLHAHVATITALLGGRATEPRAPALPPELVLEPPHVDLGQSARRESVAPSSAPRDDAPEVLVKESDQIALDTQIERARRAMASNRFDEAADLYEAMLEDDPRNVAALHGLGIIAGRRGAHAEAEGRFLEALRVDPKNAGLLNDLGFAYLMQEQFEKAETRFERALEIEPNHRLAIGNLAGLCARLGREEEALALFRRIGPEERARAEIAAIRGAVEGPEEEPSPDRTASAEDPLPRPVPQPDGPTIE